MMRKLIFYLSGAIIAIFPVISFGQIVYTGTVVNKDTRVGIPYASIGLVKQNTGINADEEGHFRFETFTSRQDSFLVSCIGYETLKVPAGTSSSPLRFELQPRASSLQEVVVKTHYNWQKATLGAYSNCGTHYYTTSVYINQVAQHFRAPESNTWLAEIEICKYGIAVIDPARTKFRVRIYSMDAATGAPSKDLCDSIIELDVTGRRVPINLEPYRILLPERDFFVAVEWLRIPLNADKTKDRYDGRKRVYYTYSPLLAIREDSSEDAGLENWELDYNGHWKQFRLGGKNIRLMISATVKY